MNVCRLRRATRIALLVIICLTFAPIRSSFAQEAQQLQLDVFINGVSKRLVGSFELRPDGTLAATRQELHDVGLGVAVSDSNGSEFVALGDLAGIRYSYDEAMQQISFEAAPDALASQRFSAANAEQKAGPATAHTGGVLNYGAYAASNLDFSDDNAVGHAGASLDLDGRMFSKFGVLSQSAILRASGPESDVLRLATTFERADPQSLMTYRAGDLISGGLSWTRPFRLGGIQAQRRFSLRPDLVTRPLPSYSGSAAVPSTVDVYVEGLRLYSRDVDPGPFEISDLPIISQNGEAIVILRDATGRQTTASLPFFSSSELLRPGLSDFSIETGVARRSFGTESNGYDDTPIGSATLRMGIEDWLTVEGHAEGGAGLVNAGGGIVASVGKWGLISAALAGSRTSESTGLLASVSLQTELLGAQIGASFRQSIGEYEDIASVTALRGAVDPKELALGAYGVARQQGSLSIGTTLPDELGSVGLNFVYLDSVISGKSQIVAGSYSRATPLGGYFNVSAYHDFGSSNSSGLYAGLSVPFGEGATATAFAGHESDTDFGLDASKPLAGAIGDHGWRVRAERSGGIEAISGSAIYRSRFARQEIGIGYAGGQARLAAQVDGAISTLGDSVAFSNRIDDSFAVVETGVAGVEVHSENQLVGVTDRNGRLLVPGLRSYERNRLSIDPSNLPIDAEVSSTEEVVVPADRSGVSVRMSVDSDPHAALVSLVDSRGAPLAVGYSGQIEGGESFVVGYDGQAYVKGLRATNTAVVETEGGQCKAVFAYKPEPGRQVAIPSVQCHSISNSDPG